MSPQRPRPALRLSASLGVVLGLAAVLFTFIGGGIVTFSNIRTLREDTDLIEHTHHVLSELDRTLSLAKDAETGQRGFLITGDEHYLVPHNQAVDQIHGQLEELEQLTRDNPDQQERVRSLKTAVNAKVRELADTISLRRKAGFDEARKVVLTDRGKAAMDLIRAQVDRMQQVELGIRQQRIAEMEVAFRSAVAMGILTALLGVGISLAVALLLRSAVRDRARQEWMQTGQLELTTMLTGDQPLEQLGANVLRFLCEYLDAHAGVFYVSEGPVFRRYASFGVPNDAKIPQEFGRGDGLLGQAVKDRKTIVINDVPDGYLTVGSALGRGKPRQLLIVPAGDDEQVNAVLEFGFLHPLDLSTNAFFERATESISAAVRSMQYRKQLQNLLEETQRQGEELQTQSEELRVSNEELEEQSRALRESQSRMENQQAELEQINEQLERQAQILEVQRDETSRKNDQLDNQARALAQASQYKSDFLANMSHELRTPLNSSLILAKLLAENPTGNLTPEQVEHAETIRSAGNDLLALINDILDLSKIEAGHMDVRLETVDIDRVLSDLARSFQPMALQKGLNLTAERHPDCATEIHTDRQRLEQILKNLLSNAIKFTEKGSVALTVGKAAGQRIAFAVSDTGIGIPADKQDVIFEAFRQADGTTNRKYGGTGLGLSISRELSKLLGGEIRLSSDSGAGATFTVVLPERLEASTTPLKPAAPPQNVVPDKTRSGAIPKSARFAAADKPVVARARSGHPEDDRERLDQSSRSILIVEDDESFARILLDLAHEKHFLCLRAANAEDAFALAVEHAPSAVVLDIGLPDHSGLWVLDRLKHEKRTRHIPVHVISASDYARTALELGAIGYLLKPVKHEDLSTALEQLESRLDQRLGRVLVVEDDPVQRDSVQKLLNSRELETVGAANAAECLEHLRNTTFDCMVLDLSLPDSTGHALLETLSREDAYSFPPVIVYTGRNLSADEEQRLRRFSQSIIIKGAKSPERLLDEVTLFLHKVISDLPPEQQRMLEKARSRDAAIEGRRILVVEDDVRNVFALTSILESRGAKVEIARNGREALDTLEKCERSDSPIDLVLMDVMMPEMDGMTAVREIRKRSEWAKLPIIMLTAKAMPNDQEECLAAGASDYMAKPLDVDKLLSLVRVWIRHERKSQRD